MRTILLSVIFSFSAVAANWTDLVEGKSYKLNQSFQLPQLERSRSLLDFSKGEIFLLKEIVPLSLPGASLALYIFDYKNCPGTEMATDMEIIPVTGSRPLVEVGAKVEDCEINMYIETKDQYSKSLFE